MVDVDDDRDFATLWTAEGLPTKTTSYRLSQDYGVCKSDYKKLTKADCDLANEIFARYPNEIKDSSEHNLAWSFRCLYF